MIDDDYCIRLGVCLYCYLCLFYVFWEEIKVHYVGLSLAFPLGGEGGHKSQRVCLVRVGSDIVGSL